MLLRTGLAGERALILLKILEAVFNLAFGLEAAALLAGTSERVVAAGDGGGRAILVPTMASLPTASLLDLTIKLFRGRDRDRGKVFLWFVVGPVTEEAGTEALSPAAGAIDELELIVAAAVA